MKVPLIRPSGTFSPRGGEKANRVVGPRPATAGRGWPEAG